MERIILFRFHKKPQVCRERLKLLRELNPGVRIYGLGEEIGIEDEFEHLHVIDNKDSDWHWMHGDLALRDWFQEVGHDISFDTLHLVEWDLLLFEPLEELYSHVPKNGLGLSGLIPMDEARERGWAWITRDDRDEKYVELREYVENESGYGDEAPACVFPGACFPKEFLRRYAETEIPKLGFNDEVRIPLFARAFGYELHDTGFYDWDDKEKFNCINNEIPLSIIEEELEVEDGRRVFHPVRGHIDVERVLEKVTK